MAQPTEIHTLAGAYALDALTEIERAAFTRHVAACESCAIEVAELTETTARLSASAWETPPSRLRAAVLAEVGRTRQVTASPVERAMPGDVRRWRRWTAAAVAAGVVALGGMATVWVVQEARVDSAEQLAADLRAEQSRVGAVLAAGDVQVHTDDATGGGKVTVAVSPRLDDGVVLVQNLAAPPPGKVYQLWLIRDSVATSAGVMGTGERSGATVLDSLGGADTLGVTLEPTGGSQKPTASTVAAVDLA